MDNVLGENAREISMDKVLRWDCRAAYWVYSSDLLVIDSNPLKNIKID